MINQLKKAYKSRGGGIAALVIMGIVVVVVLISAALALFAPKNPETAAPDNPTPPPSSSAAPSKDAQGGACGVSAGNMSLRPEVPSDLRWEVDSGWSWPVSDSLGPTKTDSKHPTCFAKSPLGASLFLTSVLNEAWVSENDSNAVLAFYMEDQEGKEAALAAGSGPSGLDQMQSAGWSNAGFRVEYFSGDEATVTTVLRSPDTETGYTGIQMDLVWLNDDWRLESKQLLQPAAPAPTVEADSFVKWDD